MTAIQGIDPQRSRRISSESNVGRTWNETYCVSADGASMVVRECRSFGSSSRSSLASVVGLVLSMTASSYLTAKSKNLCKR